MNKQKNRVKKVHMVRVAAGKLSKGPDHEGVMYAEQEALTFFSRGYKKSMKHFKQRINTTESSF